MKEMPVIFKSRGKQIVGILHLPKKKNPPVIIMCHGFLGSHIGVWYSYVDLSRELAKKGFAVLRFDYRGSGDSEGKFENQTIKVKLEDFDNALKFLTQLKSLNLKKIGVVGHSQGGVIANFSAVKHQNIKCLVEWATVADFKLFPWWTRKWLSTVMKKGYYDAYGVRRVPIKLYLDMLKYKPLQAVKKNRIPILFIHGTQDREVGLRHSILLYKAANAPKKLVKIKNADHLFSKQKHREKIINETVKWFKRWLK